MTLYTYEAASFIALASLNSSTNNLAVARNATVDVRDVDTGASLQPLDPQLATPITLATDDMGFIPSFAVESDDARHMYVRLVAGGFASRRYASTQAALATVHVEQLESQITALDARISAGAASPPGYGVGSVVVIDWDGEGATPQRVYPQGHALAGQTIPRPPNAIVRWRAPSFPQQNAADGDEFVHTAG